MINVLVSSDVRNKNDKITRLYVKVELQTLQTTCCQKHWRVAMRHRANCPKKPGLQNTKNAIDSRHGKATKRHFVATSRVFWTTVRPKCICAGRAYNALRRGLADPFSKETIPCSRPLVSNFGFSGLKSVPFKTKSWLRP